jgi:Putative sensor
MSEQLYEQSYYQKRMERAPGAGVMPVSRRRQTYLNILYLLTAFPLGTIYFVFLVTGLSVGLGTLVIWIGLPILFLTVMTWWQMAAFERQLTMHWLNVYIAPMSYRSEKSMTWYQTFKMRLTHPVTWKSLVYLIVKFPFGICSFTLAVTLVTTTVACILAPVAYLVDTFIYNLHTYPAHWIDFLNVNGQHQFSILVDGQIRASSLGELVVVSLVGVGLFFISRGVLNALALMWGEFARFMLGMSDEQAGYNVSSSAEGKD